MYLPPPFSLFIFPFSISLSPTLSLPLPFSPPSFHSLFYLIHLPPSLPPSLSLSLDILSELPDKGLCLNCVALFKEEGMSVETESLPPPTNGVSVDWKCSFCLERIKLRAITDKTEWVNTCMYVMLIMLQWVSWVCNGYLQWVSWGNCMWIVKWLWMPKGGYGCQRVMNLWMLKGECGCSLSNVDVHWWLWIRCP